jgi:16S rRNA (guanine966-N2)-methyltransferase
MMRVIAGEAKGRKLVSPQLRGLRPTSDRVREAIFDILEARSLVEGAVVLDLFSGSGALGIEALSRGAAGAIFVEQDGRAAAAIEQNLAATGFLSAAGVRVVLADVMSWLAVSPARVDLVTVDPPYEFDDWERLLRLLEPTGAHTVVAEHRAPLEPSGGFGIARAYRYGTTLVTLLRTDKDTA